MFKYGMKHSTIRYWQNQAAALWRYNGIVAGRSLFNGSKVLAEISSQKVGHYAIQCASVMSPEGFKHLLEKGW